MKSAVRKIINEILLIVVYVFMLILCLYLNRNGENTGLYINIAMFAAVFIIFAWAIVWSFMKVNKISEDFPEFKEIAEKCEKLVPDEGREEFIKSFSTPGGITEAIFIRLNNGRSMYHALMRGLERNEELSR